MALERKSPDALLEQANLSGVVTAIQDDPDTPDGSWLTAISNNAASICRTSFPTPTGNPTVGADLQEFRIWVRKMGGTGTPEVRIELWENGVLIRAGANSGVSGSVIRSFTWNANEIGTADGSLVECRIYGIQTGGSPSTRATIEVGAVEWNVTYSAGVTNYQSIPAVSIGVGVLGRASILYRTLTSTAIGTAILSTAKLFAQVLDAVVTGVTGLAVIKTFVKSLSSTAIGVAALSVITTFYKVLASVATDLPALSKGLYQTLVAITVGSALLAKVTTFKKALASAVTGIVNLATQFIAGGGGQTFYKTLSATATAVTSLLLTLNRILKVHTKTSISADLNMTSTRAVLGTITSTLKHPLKLTSTITEK